jgi:hypothetical protein
MGATPEAELAILAELVDEYEQTHEPRPLLQLCRSPHSSAPAIAALQAADNRHQISVSAPLG